MGFYKAKNGDVYDMEELMDMLDGKDSKYKDFFKNLSGDFFDFLPLDVKIELVNSSNYKAFSNSLKHKNELLFYLLPSKSR